VLRIAPGGLGGALSSPDFWFAFPVRGSFPLTRFAFLRFAAARSGFPLPFFGFLGVERFELQAILAQAAKRGGLRCAKGTINFLFAVYIINSM
jgi:hypothetical protein